MIFLGPLPLGSKKNKNFYSNWAGSVTQHTPFEIFYSKDSNFNEKIYQNTIIIKLVLDKQIKVFYLNNIKFKF